MSITTDTSPTTEKRKAPKRPRATRYMGRQAREVLIPEEQDRWINAQMNGKWSRNAVLEQCINIAMGKVEAATDQTDAIAATLVDMRSEIDKLAHQVRMVLGILNCDVRLRYLPDEQKPLTYSDHTEQVSEIVRAMSRSKS
jgi:hypothetical protein